VEGLLDSKFHHIQILFGQPFFIAHKSVIKKKKQLYSLFSDFIMLFLFLDLSDIWDRLFSHRPFLQGEIKYFLSEFDVRLINV